MKQKKLRLKRKYTKLLLLMLGGVCLIIIIYNVLILIDWNSDRNKILEETKEIDETIDIVEIEDNEEIELVNPPEETKEQKGISDYWYYIKFPLTDVNLNKLKEINDDAVGFISVAGTNINYPVVQAKDNDYYLVYSFKKQKNNAGWIFMDYRNDNAFNNKNTIIYGHGRVDNTLFGTLKNILNTAWVNNKDNYVIRYSTKEENMLFQVFSIYTIPAENYYIETSFDIDGAYIKWLETMIARSQFNFNTNVNEKDKILTLSTCKDSNGNRVVLHAKLIKKTQKTD